MDEPEVVVQLIEQYPDFKAMYEEAYRLCLNTEEVMLMFSKELAELDRNTVQLMIDEMGETINNQDKIIKEMKQEIKKEQEIRDKKLEEKNQKIKEKDKKIRELLEKIEILQVKST